MRKVSIEVSPKPDVVVFRKWTNGSILALFPGLEDQPGFCTSYEHVGQHGGADYVGCIQRTKPAKPAEYADLKQELEQIGYILIVRQRRARS